MRKTVGESEGSGEATAEGASSGEEQEDKNEGMEGYKYNQNFWGKFCCCEIVYEPEKEIGMMHQCLLGDQCREDWFHDTCLVGQAPPSYHKTYNFKQHEATEAKETKTGDAEGTDKPVEQAEKAEKAETATDSTESRASHTAVNSDSNSAAPEACKAPVATVEETGLAERSEGPKGSKATARKTDDTESAVSTFAATEEDEDDDDEDKRALSLGYPKEFAHMICFRCVDANPWLRRWVSLEGFFALDRNPTKTLVPDAGACKEVEQASQQGKRKAEDVLEEDGSQSPVKRARAEGMDISMHDAESTTTSPTSPTPATIGSTTSTEAGLTSTPGCRLPPSSSPSSLPASFSLLLPSTFRSTICRCMFCYPNLISYPILMEEEESYTPPVSRSPSPTGSMYDEGEKALNTMDRVKAIEGVLAYNSLKETVKAFLTPFAKEGRVVASEDVKDLFEGLKNGKGKK